MHYVKLSYILGQWHKSEPCTFLYVGWMPSVGLQTFSLALVLNGVFGSAAAMLFLLPQANPEAFLAGTYAVKSPVIKQLEGLLWGDLAWRGPVPIWLQSGFTRARLLPFSNFSMSWCSETYYSHSCACLAQHCGVSHTRYTRAHQRCEHTLTHTAGPAFVLLSKTSAFVQEGRSLSLCCIWLLTYILL